LFAQPEELISFAEWGRYLVVASESLDRAGDWRPCCRGETGGALEEVIGCRLRPGKDGISALPGQVNETGVTVRLQVISRSPRRWWPRDR
jgi:hypothetical protein